MADLTILENCARWNDEMAIHARRNADRERHARTAKDLWNRVAEAKA